MYDFIDFSAGTNFHLNLYCFLLYSCLILVSLRGNAISYNRHETHRGRRFLLFCGLLLFALTCFINDDFFHYYDSMLEFKYGAIDDGYIRMEFFYQYLIAFLNGEYWQFRLCVWGGSLLLASIASHLFGAKVYNTLFIILAGFVIEFSYARASLAMSAFTLGTIILCVSKERTRGFILKIVGVLILISSINLHRSMLPIILIVLGCFVLPLNKYWAKRSIYWFPVVVAIFAILLRVSIAELLDIANSWHSDESGTLDKLALYTEMKGTESNLNGYIALALKYSTFYFPFVLVMKAYSNANNFSVITSRSLILYRCVYFMFAFATSVLFIGIDSNVMFYRYLFMTFFPLSILIAYSRYIGALNESHFKWIVFCFITSNIFQFIGAIYSQI